LNTLELRPATKPATFLSHNMNAPASKGFIGDHLQQLERDRKMLPYFGVALRREPTHGRYENCKALTCVFADCDFKEHGEAAVRAAVAALPYPPTLVVNSGNGLHLYWLLTEPLTDLTRASKLLDLWVRAIPVADWGVNDVARVLRIPGTLNHKYDPPRPCVVEVAEPERRYEASELETHARLCAAERGESVPEAGVIAPAWLLPNEIAAGERHGQLYRFMRSMQSRYGLTFDEVLPLMRAVNTTRCQPPIPDHDLSRYLRRGWRGADRAGFERPTRSALFQDDGRDL
jgi:hypothetical protein